MNHDRPGTLGTALFAFPTSRCPRHPDFMAPSSSRAHLAVGVGVGEWEGGGRVRGVSWGWGGRQRLKGTWLKTRERGRWPVGGAALAEGAKGPIGSRPRPDPGACGSWRGVPTPFSCGCLERLALGCGYRVGQKPEYKAE